MLWHIYGVSITLTSCAFRRPITHALSMCSLWCVSYLKLVAISMLLAGMMAYSLPSSVRTAGVAILVLRDLEARIVVKAF